MIFDLSAEQKLIPFDDIRDDLKSVARDIIQECMDNTQPANGQPVLTHLGGIPGAGKSTYAAQLAERMRANGLNLAIVSNDPIMESLSGYRADRELNPKEAFDNWQMPARIIGYHLLHALLRGKRHILYDHGANFPDHVILLRRCKKEQGYRIVMHFLSCSPAVAQERVRRREELTGRHTPKHFLPERQKILGDLLPQYRAIVDCFIDVDGEQSFCRQEQKLSQLIM